MSGKDLTQQLADRFREVKGDHSMTDADEVRWLMLEQCLPLPGHLRSDGAEMVPTDLFALADEAGGIDRLEVWFTAHWDDPAVGREEWNAYLSGQYVCLHSVAPATIQRKEHLTKAISAAPNEPDAGSVPWSVRLHALIDELDALEPAFTVYDRLRFNSPTSRDACIDAMRKRFPRPGQVNPQRL